MNSLWEPRFIEHKSTGGAATLLSAHRLVFVGGLHRSGTTLLSRCLADHPQVSGFSGTGVPADEGQLLQSVYPPAHTFGGPGAFAFDPRAHRTETTDVTPSREAAAAGLAEQWSQHWDLTKPVLVEKSPPNLIMLRYLQHLFPTASFVLIVRHPIVVSLATARMRPTLRLPTLLAHWLHAHELAAADVPMIRRLHIVRYETLVRTPQDTLATLAAFLGLDGTIPTHQVQHDRVRRYERRWTTYHSGLRPWRRAQRRELQRHFGTRCARFGYGFDDLADTWDGCQLLPDSQNAIAT